MTRRTFVSLAGGASASGSCGWRSGESDRPLRVIASPYISTLPIYFAQEAGHFADVGLAIELEQYPSLPEVAALMAGGVVDAALMGLSPSFVNAIEKGAQVRCVAARVLASTQCLGMLRLYANASSFPDGLGDLKGLRGGTLAVSHRGSISEFTADMLLAGSGMSTSDLDLVYLPEPEATAAVSVGRIDAMIASQFEQDLTSRSDSIVRGPSLGDVAPGFQYGLVLFGQRLLDGNVDVGTRFLMAWFRGVRDFVQGATPQFAKEFAQDYNLDLGLISASCRDIFSLDGRLNSRDFQTYLDWTVRKGYCPPDIDLNKLLDERFVARMAELG